MKCVTNHIDFFFNVIYFSYQPSSLNNTLSNNCLNGTSLLRFGKKAIFSYFINYCYFRYDSYVALFFHLLTNFTKDLPIDRPHPHPRSSILLSKMLQYFIKCSFLGDRNIRWPKWLRSTAFYLWTVRKTGSFLLLYLWRDKHVVTSK